MRTALEYLGEIAHDMALFLVIMCALLFALLVAQAML